MKRFFQVTAVVLIALILTAQQPVNIQTNASINQAQVAGSTTATAATGVQKVGVVGSAGAAFDVSAGQNQAAPSNMIVAGGQFNTTPTTITSGNVSPLQLDNGGKLLVNPGTVSVTGTTDRTAVTPVLENGLSTTVQTVVGSAAKLDSYYCYNPNTSAAYVQIFDISGTVTLGTSVPKWSIGIPGSGGANLSNLNMTFANAIKVASTTTATGLTAPGTALDCNFGYR